MVKAQEIARSRYHYDGDKDNQPTEELDLPLPMELSQDAKINTPNLTEEHDYTLITTTNNEVSIRIELTPFEKLQYSIISILLIITLIKLFLPCCMPRSVLHENKKNK